MNSKSVLNKIVSLLSLENKVTLSEARLADGTVLESPTFDVGEKVEVVAEDGSKSPAPNGEHELRLKDEEGNEERFKIIVEDGVIKERENVELEEETEEVEKLPETELSDEDKLEDEVEVEVVSLEDVSKIVEEMSYRIDELEKKITEMEEVKEEVKEEIKSEIVDEVSVKEEVEMEAVTPLNGAPTNNFKPMVNSRKNASPQASFLKKLYN
jgi:hypothetical protein